MKFRVTWKMDDMFKTETGFSFESMEEALAFVGRAYWEPCGNDFVRGKGFNDVRVERVDELYNECSSTIQDAIKQGKIEREKAKEKK